MVTENLPAEESCLEQYQLAQAKDEIGKQVIDYCTVGWPKVNGSLLPYWREREGASLRMLNNLIHRIVSHRADQNETLKKIYEGHQGVERF